MNDYRFIIQICKGLIRSHRARRMLMFYDVLVVLVLMFAGSTVLWNWLRARPLIFLGYWGVCAWLTVLAAMLAIYDILIIRQTAKHERRRLEEDLNRRDSNDSHDSHTP